jgi:hypothetical protein
MARFLNEKVYEQGAVFLPTDNGQFSLNKGCTCEPVTELGLSIAEEGAGV